jgi:hypothetical protein
MTMAMPDDDAVCEALRQVDDPEAGMNIVDLGLVYGVDVTSDAVHVDLTMTTAACPMADMIVAQVNDVITSPSAQQIADACYDLADLSNQFCSVFERAGPGGGPRGEGPFEILQGSLRAVPLNYAKLKVRGIDAEIAYRKRLGALGTLSTRVNYTHQFQNDDFLDPADPNRANQLLLELGVPQDKAIWNVDFKTGPGFNISAILIVAILAVLYYVWW